MKRLIAVLAVLALILAACGGGESDSGGDSGSTVLAGDASAGEDVYKSTCASCHGADATGIASLGVDLHNNEFVDGKSDAEMVAFLNEGRAPDDPESKTGGDMPAKGANASLDDQDLYDVTAYLRTLN